MDRPSAQPITGGGGFVRSGDTAPSHRWRRGAPTRGSDRRRDVGDLDDRVAELEGGSGVPSGAVLPFRRAACPVGWTPLAGAAGRVIIGVGAYGSGVDADGANAAATYALNQVGGNLDLALTAGQMPPHSHSVDPPATTSTSTGAHTHSLSMQFSASDGVSGSDNPKSGNTSSGRYTSTVAGGVAESAGAHTHAVDVPSFSSGAAGSGSAVDVRPPFVALLYCEKD
jgi:hypothetical protein